MNDKPLSCTIKTPFSVIVESKTTFLSGCKIVDISFPSIVNPESISDTTLHKAERRSSNRPRVQAGFCRVIGEIRFQNYYVAYLTIKVKLKSTGQTPREGVPDHGWRYALKRFPLMSDPHSEDGAQGSFSLTPKHFHTEMNNIVSVRLILQQPSPLWKDFKLEDLKLFRTSGGVKGQPLPSWVMEDDKSKLEKKKVEGEEDKDVVQYEKKKRPDIPGLGAPELDALSCSLQQLWALAEEAASNQTDESLGRYEVDGCYDINLLAYS